MRSKLVYSYSIKIHALGFNKLLQSIFCLPLVVEAFSLQKVIEILEEGVWWMRQNLVAQFFQLLNHWLCDIWSGIVMEKHWAPSVDQYWLQALQFSVHLIDLLSILLRCNGFTGIQKAVVDQMGSRPPVVTVTLFWCEFSFGKGFGASSQFSHWVDHHWLYKIHFLLYITIPLRNGSLLCRIRWCFKMMVFLISS